MGDGCLLKKEGQNMANSKAPQCLKRAFIFFVLPHREESLWAWA
jgi:hypothetical protein